MEFYLGVARAEGITDEKIGAIQAVVVAVSAGKINAQLKEMRSRMKAGPSAAGPSMPNT